MSHFTVLVPAKDREELEAKLLPYHEYECTGIEQYVEFVPTDMDKLRTDYEKYGEERDFDDWAKEWDNLTKNEQGVYGRLTNPNKKWDWWVVGGRWTGLLHLKSHHPEGSGSREPGLMTAPNRESTKGDYAYACDVDWEGMLAQRKRDRADDWDVWQTFIEKTMRLAEYLALNDEQQKAFWSNAHAAIYAPECTPSEEEKERYHTALFFEQEGKTREEHVNAREALTFAFIDLEGKWNERGHMGWWAIVSGEDYNYDETFWKFVKTIPDDRMVFVVDAHI